jgi:hypothetical protein
VEREKRPYQKPLLKKGDSFIVLVALLLTLYLGFSFAAPGKLVRSLGDKTAPDAEKMVIADTEMLSLLYEKSFLEARLVMATSDSIGFVVNIPDSTITLEVRGVTLHASKIGRSEAGRFFGSLKPVEYSQLLGMPIRIIKQKATIDKIPIRIVDAPTDSAGVALTMFVPDTSYTGNVHLTLYLDNGIKIRFIDSESGKIAILFRDIGSRSEEFLKSLYSVIRFRIPDYHPIIRIYLNGDEIRTIYRAIPNNGVTVVRPIF